MAFINSLASTVFGTSGNDTINSQLLDGSFSTIYGGLGNDIYYIDAFYENGATDTPADVIVEAAGVGSGTDTVILNMYFNNSTGDGNTNYTLADNVENIEAGLLSYAGTHTFDLTGNSLANRIAVTYNADARVNLNGGAGNDTLIGGVSNDVLTGGTGADVMQGGDSGDTYYVDNVLDKVIESALDDGTDRVFSTVSYTLGANVETLELTSGGNISGTGNAQSNRLFGSFGNNVLNGLAGSDSLYGNDGNDVLNGGDGDDKLFGNYGNDTLLGGAGNDTLYGDSSASYIDKLDGGAGDDNYYVSHTNDVISDSGIGGDDTVTTYSQLSGDLGAGIENLRLYSGVQLGRGNGLGNIITGNSYSNTLFGLAGDDILNGGGNNDILDGGEGNDTLDGGANDDLMRGGNGNDTYLINSASDLAIETNASAAGGIDTVFSEISYTLGANIENLTMTGAANIGLGNTSNNIIIGSDNGDLIDGKYGNDSINGGIGNDSLTGDGGNDTLNGGAGNDSMYGGLGADVYYVDSSSDYVSENGGDGIDTIFSSAYSFTMGSVATNGSIENLVLLAGAAYAYGNDGNNKITGNANSNLLFGGAGADTLIGGLGNDRYYVDNIGDVVTELAGQGTDSVYSAINFTLGALSNLENLYLSGTAVNATGNALNNYLYGNGNANSIIGGAGNDNLYGNGGIDTLKGGDGNDVLNGGAGADNMVGGLGNDFYLIDNAGDVIDEGVGAGTDTLSYGLAGLLSLAGSLANIENAILRYGFGGTNLTGNGLTNVLTGNELANSIDGGANNDTLIGGAGIDTLIGGAGNDVFIVDSSGDNVRELIGGGTDRVESSVSFELDTNAFTEQIENITLTGSANIYADGNDLNNMMIGNSGNNTLYAYGGNDTLIGGLGNDSLRGYGGADSMVGGLGNDNYFVDIAGDKVVELANQGVDTVYSSISFNLTISGANVENLTLQGAAISATGNALNNRIFGNNNANVLSGGVGDDTLSGGSGNDTLAGGVGNDVFRTYSGGGIDVINDFVSGTDILSLGLGGLTFTGGGNSLTASQFALGTAGVDADDFIIYDQATGNLYYDADGNGGLAVQIFDFAGIAPVLSSGDIFSA